MYGKLIATSFFALGLTIALARGAAADDGLVSRTICKGAGECAAGHYCHFEDGKCGPAHGGENGLCLQAPILVPFYILKSPVCGCDGKQYNNAYFAWKAGTDVAHVKASCSKQSPKKHGG